MYCQHCFDNVIKATTIIKDIKYLDINMQQKIIKIKYQDNNLTDRIIRNVIDKAITTGKINKEY